MKRKKKKKGAVRENGILLPKSVSNGSKESPSTFSVLEGVLLVVLQ